jgi:hyaluronan-mediated motility receptor
MRFSFSLLDKVADLEKRYKETELLIGPFREQLEAFDEERQALELRKEAAEGEMRELGLRYAEILGHQNHKQKIKHMTKLREQIHELQKVGC